MPTTPTDPKVLAETYNAAFNCHDETALGSLIAPNARFSAPGGVGFEGQDAVIGYTNSWMKAPVLVPPHAHFPAERARPPPCRAGARNRPCGC
jgi:hypothetical protein